MHIKILLAITFSCFTLLAIAQDNNDQPATPNDMQEQLDQLNDEMKRLADEFNNMPGYNFMWSDSLKLDDLNLQEWQRGFSQIDPQNMDMQGMMEAMEQMLGQFSQSMPDMEHLFHQFEFPPLPNQQDNNLQNQSDAPQSIEPNTKSGKKRKVYSM